MKNFKEEISLTMYAKRFLSIILACSLVFSLFAVFGFADNQNSQFLDMPTPDDWYYDAALSAIDNGIIKGSNGKLNLSSNITRAEFATVVNNLFGASDKADISKYTDVKQSKWYYDDMSKAVQMKSFLGGASNNLCPEENITRQDAFLVLFRVMKLEDGDVSALSKFADASNVSSYAASALATMVQKKYVAGNGDYLYPTAYITRAEVAQIIFNLFSTYINKPGEYTGEYKGNVIVSVPDVILKNAKITGDLILADGIGDGEVTLNKTSVSGNVIVRGGGVNSILITNGSNIGSIIIAKTAEGALRVYCADGSRVDIVKIDDGNDEIKLEGAFKNVTVASNTEVVLKDANIVKLNIESADASVSLESGSIVTVNIKETATDAVFKTEENTKVGTINNEAGATVDAEGKVQKINDGGESEKQDDPENPGTGGGKEPTNTIIVNTLQELKAISSSGREDTIVIPAGKNVTVKSNIMHVDANLEIAQSATLNVEGKRLELESGYKLNNKGTINITGNSSNGNLVVYSFASTTDNVVLNEGTINANQGSVNFGNFLNKGAINFKESSSISINSGAIFTNEGNVKFAGGHLDLRDATLDNNATFNLSEGATVGATPNTAIYGLTKVNVSLEVDASDKFYTDGTVELGANKTTITCDGEVVYKNIWKYSENTAFINGQGGLDVFKDYYSLKSYEEIRLIAEDSANPMTLNWDISSENIYISSECDLVNTASLNADYITVFGLLENNGTLAVIQNIDVYGTLKGNGTFDVEDAYIYAYDNATVLAPEGATVYARYDCTDYFRNDGAIELHKEASGITVGKNIQLLGEPYNQNRAYIDGTKGLESFKAYANQNYKKIVINNYENQSLIINCNLNANEMDVNAWGDNSSIVIGEDVTITCDSLDLQGKIVNNGKIARKTTATGGNLYVYETLENNGQIDIGKGSVTITEDATLNNKGSLSITLGEIYVGGLLQGTGLFDLGSAKIYAYDGASVLAPRGAEVHIQKSGDDRFYADGTYNICAEPKVTLGYGIRSIKDYNQESAQAYIEGQRGYASFVRHAANNSYGYVSVRAYDEQFEINASDFVNASSLSIDGMVTLNVAEDDILSLERIDIYNGTTVNNYGTIALDRLWIDDGYSVNKGVYVEGIVTQFNNNGILIIGGENSGTIHMYGPKTRFVQNEDSYLANYGSIYLEDGSNLTINSPIMLDEPSMNGFYCTGKVMLSDSYYNLPETTITTDNGTDLSKLKIHRYSDKKVYSENDFFRALNDSNCTSVIYHDGIINIPNDMQINKRITVEKLVIPAGITLTFDDDGSDSYIDKLNIKGTLNVANGNISSASVSLDNDGIIIIGQNTRISAREFSINGQVFNNGKIRIEYYDEETPIVDGTGTIYNDGLICYYYSGEYGKYTPVEIECNVVGGGKVETDNNINIWVRNIDDLKTVLADDKNYGQIHYNGDITFNEETGISEISKPVYFEGNTTIAKGFELNIYEGCDFYDLQVEGALLIDGQQEEFGDFIRTTIYGNCEVNGTLKVKNCASLGNRQLLIIDGQLILARGDLSIVGNAVFAEDSMIEMMDAYIFIGASLTQYSDLVIDEDSSIQMDGYYEVQGKLINNGSINCGINEGRNAELCVMPGGELENNGRLDISDATVTIQAFATYSGDGSVQCRSAKSRFINNNDSATIALDGYFDETNHNFVGKEGFRYIFSSAGLYSEMTNKQYYSINANILGNKITKINTITEYEVIEIQRKAGPLSKFSEIPATLNDYAVSDDVIVVGVDPIDDDDLLYYYGLTCFLNSEDKIVKIFVNDGSEYAGNRRYYKNYFGQTIFTSDEIVHVAGTVIAITEDSMTLATPKGNFTYSCEDLTWRVEKGDYIEIETDGTVLSVYKINFNDLFFINELCDYSSYGLTCALVTAEYADTGYYEMYEEMLLVDDATSNIITGNERLLYRIVASDGELVWSNDLYGKTVLTAAQYVENGTVELDSPLTVKVWNEETKMYDTGSRYDLMQITNEYECNLALYDKDDNGKYDFILIY